MVHMYHHETAATILSLTASTERAFPMFGPLGERAWAGPEWTPEVLWADGEGDREGMVFRQKGEVWVNVRFDSREHVAEYVRFGETVVTRIRVILTPRGDDACSADVRYDWIALSEEGNKEVVRRRESLSIDWEEAVNAALDASR
jgi:hypothetical protein